MKKTEFKVDGMTCIGCVKNVEKVLRAIPGVDKVSVILEQGQVTVEFDPARVQEQGLKQAIEDAGYDMLPSGRG
ncbi:heavy metal-associated domain-containing protein [Bdellovibrionota bacterium FG-1]